MRTVVVCPRLERNAWLREADGMSTTERLARPPAFLAREAWLFLAIAPPMLVLLLSDSGAHATWRQVAGCVVATWLGTLTAGTALHLVVNALTARLPAAGAIRYPLLVLAGVATVVATLRVVLPPLSIIAPHLRTAMAPTVGRGVVLGAIYVVIARTYAVMALRARRETDRAQGLAHAALRARLEALQAQTHPHFLFNSLNAIASLIPDDPDLAESLIERLAGVLQYSLAAGSRGSVSLGEEIATVRDYLEIERTRFGARLRVRIEMDPGVEGTVIPPMLLQPLVENAVLHGIAAREGGGEVTVTARDVGGHVVVRIADDGVGPGGSPRRGTQTGLRGVRERIALTYGDAAQFDVRAREGGGFECELTLPAALSVQAA